MIEQVTVTVGLDRDIYETIEGLARGARRTVDEEVRYIVGRRRSDSRSIGAQAPGRSG